MSAPADRQRLSRQLAESRRRAEEAEIALRAAHAGRQRAELALRSLFETMRSGYSENALIRDVDGHAVDYRIEAANPRFERVTGLSASETVGRNARELSVPFDDAWIDDAARVVHTGVPERFEHEDVASGRWFEVQVYPLGDDRFAILYDDVTERRRDDAAVRDSEVRHRLLIESWTQAVWETDAAGSVVRDSPSWRAYTGQTREEWLGYGWLDAIHPDDRAYAERQWREAMAARRVVDAEFRLRAPDGGWRWTNVRAAPVLDARGDIEKWAGVNIDIEARKRAESALRESEARFQQFADASAAGMWIRDATTLAMEYVSPATDRIYGVEPGTFLGDMKAWARLILPEDRETALERVEAARRGEAVVHEFRIQRPDNGAFRWIRNTDFPLFDIEGRVQRVGGLAEDVTDNRMATEHQGVLLSELQHRVRNIMAVIRSIATRTAHNVENVADYSRALEGRLLTLARVQALLTRQANTGAEIHDVVQDELLAQATHAGQFVMTGPNAVLPPKTTEVLTLAMHELTTNAVKYGALSASSGMVEASWSIEEKTGGPWLVFDWKETGAPTQATPDVATTRRRGFGSELIEARIPYELGGSASVTITPGGAQCHMTFPLKPGPSMLETDAPERSIVFGGMIDMANQADLNGQRILVLEDDFYLAGDTARAIASAGATVIGPCPASDDAMRTLSHAKPTAAVVDINLGRGPSFEVPEALTKLGVPFVFLTGYDVDIIPPAFASVPRLQKPADLARVVNALADVSKARGA